MTVLVPMLLPGDQVPSKCTYLVSSNFAEAASRVSGILNSPVSDHNNAVAPLLLAES